MYLVIRKDFDLMTGQLVNLFVERCIVDGTMADAEVALKSVKESILSSYARFSINYELKEYPDGTYIKANVCMVILSISDIGDCNGSHILYHHEIENTDPVEDAAKAISRLAKTTVENAKGILSCFGYEIDGKPVMLVDKPVDMESQVGMKPAEFKEFYKDILDEPKVSKDDIEQIKYAVDRVCEKHRVDRHKIYEMIEVGGKTLSELTD